MQSRAPVLRGGHVHGCPECYERVPCDMDCTCEPDLTLDDGTPRGGYVVCNECSARLLLANPVVAGLIEARATLDLIIASYRGEDGCDVATEGAVARSQIQAAIDDVIARSGSGS